MGEFQWLGFNFRSFRRGLAGAFRYRERQSLHAALVGGSDSTTWGVGEDGGLLAVRAALFLSPPLLSATVQEEEPGWWWSLGKPAAQSYPRSLTSLLRAFYTEEGM